MTRLMVLLKKKKLLYNWGPRKCVSDSVCANVYKILYVYMSASCLLACISVFLYVFLQVYSVQPTYLNVIVKEKSKDVSLT